METANSAAKTVLKAARSLFAAFKTDPELEKNGVVLLYSGLRLTVARAGGANTAFGKLLNARLKPYERQMQQKTMDNDVADDIVRKTYADAIIKFSEVELEDGTFIEGCTNEAGDVLPFTPANVEAMFVALPDLFRDVQSQAQLMTVYRAEDIQDTIKN